MLLMECPQYIWREEALHFSSVIQSCPTLWPHGLQHTRLSCPSPTPGSCSNSCPSSWWCHSTTSAGFGFWESGSVQQAFALGTKLHALGECVSSLSWTLCCRIDWWDWVWLSQDMTGAEYAMGISYWISVYRQFNEKLNVVLSIYSFLK